MLIVAGLVEPARYADLQRLLARAAARLEGVIPHVLPKLVTDWGEVQGLALQGGVGLVIVDAFWRGRLCDEPCGVFRRAFASVPIVAISRPDQVSVSDIFALARVGVTAAVVDGDPRAEEVIASALAHSSYAATVGTLRDALSPAAMSLVARLIPLMRARSIRQLGQAIGRHPKTLRLWAREAGLPPLGRLTAWLRLMHAAHLLGDRARTVENVATALGYPSANAFRNQLRRYLGVTPSMLARPEGSHLVMRAFAADMRVHAVSTSSRDATAQATTFRTRLDSESAAAR